MKVHLMFKEKDFDADHQLIPDADALIQDLELNTLFRAMASGDDFIFETVKKSILDSLDNPEEIFFRQGVLEDCIENPEIIREMYNISVSSIKKKRDQWLGVFSRYPGSILSSAVRMIQMFTSLLGKINKIADKNGAKFKSEGFKNFFNNIRKELSDDYLNEVRAHLKELQFHDGVLLSASLGKGNEGSDYILRKPNEKYHSLMHKIIPRRQNAYTFHISPNDTAGATALSELKDEGINLVANALAQSADHIDRFFEMLRTELAFYIGCVNLHEQLSDLKMQSSFPEPVSMEKRKHKFTNLYDICLTLTVKKSVIGNDMNADNKNLFVITGANQGGKSTFIRSIGVAQLMMQCGMFVPAEVFSVNICRSLFTHFIRKEDDSMEAGKLDEELNRMSNIVDLISRDSIVLFNESFSSTNEREGSEIARQIVSALLEKNIKVFFVTHFYELAGGFFTEKKGDSCFMRAERKSDGSRTFKIIEGEPLQTSYGEDLYSRIFK